MKGFEWNHKRVYATAAREPNPRSSLMRTRALETPGDAIAGADLSVKTVYRETQVSLLPYPLKREVDDVR